MFESTKIKELENRALELRRKIIKISSLGEAGHITTSFSCLDILVALYFGGIMRYDSSNPEMPERDRFILSKGHGALAIYNVLADAGFFDYTNLKTYCRPKTIFGGHPTPVVPGIEHATGALGHGLPFAVGAALAARIKKADYLVYALTGDGECEEGSIWEAAMSIAQFNLTNLIWIIDYNKLQIKDEVNKMMRLDPLEKKLEAFGFEVYSINGHDYDELLRALCVCRSDFQERPKVVVANTVKGKGIPAIEGKLGWHARKPSADEFAMMIKELGLTKEEFEAL